MSVMDLGQTRIVGGQTVKDFFSGGPSLHHHSGTLSAAANDSVFRFDDMPVSFPPLSASAPESTTAATHRSEMRSHGGGNRVLGTSRGTGSAAWSGPRAPVKRRGSLSSLGDSNSSGHHQPQRQTLKLADITDFDLTRPSAFEKLSSLYRDKSSLAGPSAYTVWGHGDREHESSSKSKQKPKSGLVSHHVHLPRISMDSSPPLVYFRHSRIKPSTLTEHETGVPGKTQPSPGTDSSSASVTTDAKLAPHTRPIRKNEHSMDKSNNSSNITDKSRNSGTERQKHIPEPNNETTPSTSPKTPRTTTTTMVTKHPISHVTQDASPTPHPVQKGADSLIQRKTSNDPPSSNLGESTNAARSRGLAPSRATSNSPVHPPSPGTRYRATSTAAELTSGRTGAPNQRRRLGVGGLSLSEYTSIVINNDGWEGETLSAVKGDTFLGERRTVRFSVSTEVIEYEPGSPLAGDDNLPLDVDGRPCEVIAE